MNGSRPKMRLRVRGVSNRLWNDGLTVVPKAERTWGVYDFAWLWVATSVCIPAYLLAGGLIALGMNWMQALGTILLGNVIVSIAMALNGHAGAKYGIPFPVAARASFGVLGANVPMVLRGVVACGWFGIQCWIGGQALFAMLRLIAPSVGSDAVWACFAAFWLVQMTMVWRGIGIVKPRQRFSVALLLIVGLASLFWAMNREGEIGAVLGNAVVFRAADEAGEFWKIFVPSLTGVVGFWSVVALNIADYTRRARSQKAQILGQAIGMPVAMTVFSFIAIAVTTATVIVTPGHAPAWNPIEVIVHIHQPFIVLVGLGVVLLATLSTNTAMNEASPSNAFSSLRPNLISFRMGGLFAGGVGIACMPWKLVASPEVYIKGWLVGSSGLMGPIAGIMIADYFILRHRSLDVDELYVRDGMYEYTAGFNAQALIALSAGVFVALVGMFVPRLHWLYECTWFVGFAVAAVFYLMLMSGPDVRAMIPPNPLLIPVDGFEAEPSA